MLFESKVSTAFINRVQQAGDNLNVNPDWLMYIMNNETAGTFSPSIKNPNSSATGLLQFLKATAEGLGTTTDQLAAMSDVEQMDYVEAYFKGIISEFGPLKSVSDTYLAVFYPAAINWTEEQRFSNTVYGLNKVFDIEKLGYLTKSDFEDYVNTHYAAAGGGDTGSDETPDESKWRIPQISTFVNNLNTTDTYVLITGAAIFVILLFVTIFLSLKSKRKK